jgi:POT family proton-dependent oligopeptide transporter
MMMGLWFITSFTGNLLQGYIGSFFSAMDKTHFFLLCAVIGGIAGAVTWLFDRPLRSVLESRTDTDIVITAELQAEPHLEPHAGE